MLSLLSPSFLGADKREDSERAMLPVFYFKAPFSANIENAFFVGKYEGVMSAGFLAVF